MNSRVTDDFVALFATLPSEVQKQARKSYRLWRANPSHPGLHFKQIRGHHDVYSVRVSLGWRAVGLLEQDTINWFWIGSHADYDRLLARL
jgi:hypothetical protein